MSSKKNEIDTYAQWTHLGWLIDFEMPPKENQLSNISATPDRVQGANETIEVELQFKSYDHTFTGELHQVVPDGQAMNEVIIGIAESAYSKMFPASWQKNETRPSGIVMTGVSDNGNKLIFNGTPTSNDTITVPELVLKPKISVNVTDKNASVTTTDKDLYFVTSGNVTIVPNDTYKFPDNTTLDSFTITPETMKKYMKLIKNDNGSVTINVNGVGHVGEMVNVSISTPSLVKSAYRVEVSLGENITSSGGALVQDVEIGQPMTQINLAVDSTKVIASFFPDTHNISKDGVSVNTDTSTNKPYIKAWISGTPLRPTSISVPAPVNGYHVVVTGGANCTHVSGSLDQYVKSGDSIETVVFRCNEGYWFGKYNGGSNNTMSIKLNPEKTEITLSGRPASMNGFGDFDVRLEDAVEKDVNGGEYMLTVDSIGSNLFGIAGFRSKECRGPATSSVDKNVTFGSITPGNYFGQKIIGCYISGSDGRESALRGVSCRVTGTCYMVLELENKDHSGVSGSVICGMTFKTLDISSRLDQEGSIDQDTLYFSSEDHDGTIFGYYTKLLAEKGKTIPVIIAPMQ